jgi:hypothetical protein
MKTKILQWIPVMAVLMLTTGCMDEIVLDGNGDLRSEIRPVNYFNEVTNSGSFIIEISQGENYEVTVEAESNLLPYINTDASHGKLSVDVKGIHRLNNNLPMKVSIVTPQLTRLVQSGSGKIVTDFYSVPEFKILVSGSGQIVSSVDADDINVNISGSGLVTLEGGADRADIKISGSGQFDGYDLRLTDCETAISGSGRIYVNVFRSLVASISGSGSVFYIGTPVLYTSISGSGRVIDDN